MNYFRTPRSVGRLWSDESLATSENVSSSSELRVVAFDDPPYISVQRGVDGSLTFDGYLYHLWKILAQELDLRYRLVPSREGGYGITHENGTWNGLVGELVNGRADVALTWLNIRPDRAAVVDLIDAVPVERERYTFYVRQGARVVPDITPALLGSIFRPLQLHVWLLLLASLVVLSAALCFCSQYDRAKQKRTGKELTVEEVGWGSCLFSVFMSMVGQGWTSTPRSSSARIITSITWMLGMLININYTANLISFLAVTKVDRPISSLQEFADRPSWQLAIEKGSGIVNDWKESDSALERDLYHRVLRGKGMIELDGTVENSRRAVLPEVLSYIDINRLIYPLGSEACAVVPLLDDMPSQRNTYMAMAKGRDDLKQAGILNRLKRLWLTSQTSICQSSGEFRALTFGDLLPILLLIPIAVVSSIIILVLEFIKKSMLRFLSSRLFKLVENIIF